jgi:hypothetical protein
MVDIMSSENVITNDQINVIKKERTFTTLVFG